MNMKTKEEFIERAKKVHGNRYDYSRVEFVDDNTKVCIICPKHGEFWQTPKSHVVRKYGCSKCGRDVCANKNRKSTTDFVNAAIQIHGDKYDYSMVNYVNAFSNVQIICPIHGIFEQAPHEHLKGHGCPLCGNESVKNKLSDTVNDFIKKAQNIHGDKYDYSKVEYVNQNTEVEIICHKHGIFKQKPSVHLNGCGCYVCGIEKTKYAKQIKTSDFIKRANIKFNNYYNYDKTDLSNRDTEGRVIVSCPIHGDFNINPSWHLGGVGCPECGKISSSLKRRNSNELFLERANNIHNGKYSYPEKYIGYKKKINILCPVHGLFEQTPDDHLQGKGCPKCGKVISRAENEIYEYCCQCIGNENVQQRNKIIIKPFELDIYLRSISYAIEYNGLRWHSEKFGKDKNYHLNKLNACQKKNIKLIQIFEDEYVNHRDIVYHKLSHIMGFDQSLPRIAARKCEIREIDNKIAKDFLNKYHIQGYVGSKIYLGAFYEGNLVSVMTFKSLDKSLLKWELTRFASDYNYICQGIGGKLFKYFVRKYNPEEIKSFADRRWTTDENSNIYIKLGFKFECYTNPEYRYFKESDGLIRQHKFGFRKNRLNKKYGLPLSMTEEEMTEKLGYTRIYDCGLIKYVWKQ